MNGKIRISKVTDSTKDEDLIRITLQDSVSRVQFLTIDVEMDAFARALFGIEGVSCEFSFNNLKAIGKTKEVQIFEIQTDKPYVLPYEKLELLAKDGWEVQLSSKQSGRNYYLNDSTAPYTYTAKITFERFV